MKAPGSCDRLGVVHHGAAVWDFPYHQSTLMRLKGLQLSAFHTVYVVLSSYNQAVRQFLWTDICVGGVSRAVVEGPCLRAAESCLHSELIVIPSVDGARGVTQQGLPDVFRACLNRLSYSFFLRDLSTSWLVFFLCKGSANVTRQVPLTSLSAIRINKFTAAFLIFSRENKVFREFILKFLVFRVTSFCRLFYARKNYKSRKASS